jgi:hypothetical protein
VPDRELDPINMRPIVDSSVAPVSRRKPRLGVSKGKKRAT